MLRYAGLVDNPTLLPTLIQIIKLSEGLVKELSPSILKGYYAFFGATYDSVMNYDENFKLRGDSGDIKVADHLKLAMLNIKRFDKLMYAGNGFEELAEQALAIYNELTKRQKRFASYGNANSSRIPLLEQSLKRMSNLYDMVSTNRIYSDPSLRQIKTSCTKLANSLNENIIVAGENLMYFFEDSAKIIAALNVALNSIDRKEPGLFVVSYEAMEMLESLRSRVFF